MVTQQRRFTPLATKPKGKLWGKKAKRLLVIEVLCISHFLSYKYGEWVASTPIVIESEYDPQIVNAAKELYMKQRAKNGL